MNKFKKSRLSSYKETGQTIFMGLMFSLLLISIISYGIYKTSGMYNKINVQNISDSAAYSGAVIQAKILNAISALNQGIVFITNLVVTVVVIWLALKACCALCFIGFCYCAPIERTYSRLAKPFLKLAHKISWAMSDIQDFLMEKGKWLVIEEIKRVAKLNGAKSIFTYPELPIAGLPDSMKFKFNLIRANKAKELSKSSMSEDAIRFSTEEPDKIMTCYVKKWASYEYEKAFGYYYKSGPKSHIDWIYVSKDNNNHKTFSEPKGRSISYGKGKSKLLFSFESAKTVKCQKISKILTKGYKLPSPLILNPDFKEKQKILVYIKAKSLENVTALKRFKETDKSFSALAQSEPFGSTMFDMEWQARLERITLLSNLTHYVPFLKSFSGELINH